MTYLIFVVKSNEDKMKMIEILERVKENEIIDINSDDDDDPSIEERLSGIDLGK